MFRFALMLCVALLGFAASSDPWTPDQVVRPAELASRIESGKAPTVIMVGPRLLYNGAHIKGAEFAGPAEKPEGLEMLMKQIVTVPKDAELILYCGCCPMEQCPRIRPAFKAVHDAGYANARILDIPTNLHKDWVEKGYPTEKGSTRRP